MDKFKFGRPLGGRLVVRADDAKTTTDFGFELPDTAQERPQVGTVLAIGTEVKDKELNVGDRVLFGKMAGIPLVVGDITYFVMAERDLFAVLDEEEILAFTKLVEASKPVVTKTEVEVPVAGSKKENPRHLDGSPKKTGRSVDRIQTEEQELPKDNPLPAHFADGQALRMHNPGRFDAAAAAVNATGASYIGKHSPSDDE